MKTAILGVATACERAETIATAVEHLRRGEAIALPTETVYGLAADALSNEAVLKIFAAKERPRFNPLIVHLPNREWLARVAAVAENEPLIARLADRFWPGPLTFVLRRTSMVPDLVTSGLETVAVRMSAHPVFCDVIEPFAGPLAAPSANRFGHISSTEAAHVHAELDGRIPLIVDGGTTTHGVESTIIEVREDGIAILRHGPITAEQLSQYAELRAAPARAQPTAPGQLRSHYAPRTPLQIATDLGALDVATKRVGLLALRRGERGEFAEIRTLSLTGDLHEAAANLFRLLRELDAAELDLIIAEPVPEQGIGSAIMDRLRRAASERLP